MANKSIVGSVGLVGLTALTAGAFGSTPAHAADVKADAAVSTEDLGKPSERNDSGAFLAAGKVGGIASFNGLGPFVIGGVELGYVFGGTNRRIAALLDVTYTAPNASGSDKEAFDPQRIPGGTYDWELRQKELVFQPTFMYRLTGLTATITPYAGIGPRIYLLESVVRGSSGGKPFQDTTEHSTKIGFGIPLGAELALGPGGVFAELHFQWAPLDHQTTGDTQLGGGSLFLGYRALL